MQAELPAALHSWIDLLQKCRHSRNLPHAKRLWAFMRNHELDSHPILGNYLIPTLVECGSLLDAHSAFDNLGAPDRNLHSWNSLISGYLDCGQTQRAFNLYQRMQETEHPVQPSRVTYLALLNACARLKDSERGRVIHTNIVYRGLEKDIFDGSAMVGNALLHLYGKCGLLAEAQRLFDKLPVWDAVSWNSMISGYAELGLSEEALYCFKLMHLKGTNPVPVTYIASLKACATILAVETSQEIHTEATKRGLEKDLFFGSTLVDTYAECDFLAEACQVVELLPHRDIVLWNALIAGFVEHGMGEKVRECVQRIVQDNISPNSITFVCTLKDCANGKDVEIGILAHAEATKIGLEKELHVGSTLVGMYSECSAFAEAKHVFDGLTDRNAVSWNALITGYARHGWREEVVKGFQQMLFEGISPNMATLVCILKVCSATGTLEIGRETHDEIIKRGLDGELYVGNTLVNMYAECGPLVEARHVFDRLPVQDAVSWNTLIAGYTEHGLGEEAGTCFNQMLLQGTFPDAVTLLCSLKACGTLKALETGQEIHAETAKRGLEREGHVGSTLVDMYIECGSLLEARQVFDQLPVRVSDSWNALITGYSEHGLNEEAGNFFDQMLLEDVSPDEVTFVSSLKACAATGSLDYGQEIHTHITKRGLETDLHVANMLLDMYSECGLLGEAHRVFDQLPFRSSVSWNALIKAYGKNHKGLMAVQCFESMLQQGVKPTPITLTCVLAACSHSSMVLKGQEYFQLMTEEHNMEPTADHYACMVDLLARSGHVYEAERFVAAVRCPWSSIILSTLLSACKVYGKVDLGHSYFQQLVLLNEEDSSAYLLMSDIYASAGRWIDATRLDECRKDVQANKKPGSASIEINKKLNLFVVGMDQATDVLELLEKFGSRVKGEDYVPNSTCSSF